MDSNHRSLRFWYCYQWREGQSFNLCRHVDNYTSIPCFSINGSLYSERRANLCANTMASEPFRKALLPLCSWLRFPYHSKGLYEIQRVIKKMCTFNTRLACAYTTLFITVVYTVHRLWPHLCRLSVFND